MDFDSESMSKHRSPKLELISNRATDSNSLSTPSGLAKNEGIDLTAPTYYGNRELSHFKFNLRVLSQAKNHAHPLLERLMFLLIFSSNLDEFFEIRISGLKKQLNFIHENVIHAI